MRRRPAGVFGSVRAALSAVQYVLRGAGTHQVARPTRPRVLPLRSVFPLATDFSAQGFFLQSRFTVLLKCAFFKKKGQRNLRVEIPGTSRVPSIGAFARRR